jgi:hypothetical protein
LQEKPRGGNCTPKKIEGRTQKIEDKKTRGRRDINEEKVHKEIRLRQVKLKGKSKERKADSIQMKN